MRGREARAAARCAGNRISDEGAVAVAPVTLESRSMRNSMLEESHVH